MSKQIIIKMTDDTGKWSLDMQEMNHVEVMGILRFYEKWIWLKLAKAAQQGYIDNEEKSNHE
jgi:hypothetical protein